MEIKPAEDKDIPAIVALLKLSLGESLMPKSEAFWRWKHIDNPFGKSPVLLAFEDSQLIGVRAFMRWKWQRGEEIIQAVRAVDTATHPSHQGKGIFRSLTMQLVEQCKSEGVQFVYNTPNKSSMPGYLKMGWEARGKLPVRAKAHLFKRELSNSITLDSDWDKISDHKLWQQSSDDRELHTMLTPEYLCWRYRDNPNVKYELLSSNQDRSFILIYRKKKIKWFTEVRITDLICKHEDAAFAIQCLQSVEPLSLITLSGINPSHSLPGFKLMRSGPIVTVRNLNMGSWPDALQFTNWSPALGDLELF